MMTSSVKKRRKNGLPEKLLLQQVDLIEQAEQQSPEPKQKRRNR
jgi:hypothetical protein